MVKKFGVGVFLLLLLLLLQDDLRSVRSEKRPVRWIYPEFLNSSKSGPEFSFSIGLDKEECGYSN